MEMPSARDCPMGPISRYLGIRGHVKLTVRTETSKGIPNNAEEVALIIRLRALNPGEVQNFRRTMVRRLLSYKIHSAPLAVHSVSGCT
ncbi:hypothetical protein EVAR_16505_1 [Eumeta japonica]|uniref:Uncharacterized protein n=1 Tax=Eumeta variegata TaxID=151549 RepID=A0A4C1UKD8_EUMVA|nr:hypothetical protein EVAR_16505_1 [Eumeta japonica]